jgi:hypothetical protein
VHKNKGSKKLTIAVTILTFLLLATQTFGQSANGSLSGIVQDPSKAVLPNAKVTVKHIDTNTEKATLTNSAGIYSFPSLQPGLYKMTVEASGFKTYARSEVRIETGGQGGLNVEMEVGPAKEITVAVTANAAGDVLETSPTTGTVLQPDYLTNLPTVSNDVMEFVNAIGGVIPTEDPLFGADNQMLMGTAAPGIAVIKDGINVNEVRWSTGINTPSRINPELVQEFKVVLSPADAEYGRGAGQVQILSKSGGNAYHGSVVYNVQNRSLDAKGWNARNYANNWRNQHNYTASVGGPIIKQKLFFFLNWDHTISRNREDVTPSVLTPCARKGVYRYFSGWANGNASQVTNTGTAGGLATIATVNEDGTPRIDQITLQPDRTTASSLQMQSVFGQLNANARALLAQDPINCSKYDPYTDLGVSTYWETGTNKVGLRQLDPVTVPRFSALMPLPNNYGISSNETTFFASNTGGDGLNTATHKWTRSDGGTGTVYAQGSSPSRKTINTNINYNLSERHRLSGNYTTELSGGTGATKLWPDTPGEGKSYRRPQQFGVTVTSTVKPTMLNEARFGLARTVSHAYAPINSPDDGTAVKKMLMDLVPTDNFPNYKGIPLIVGLGPDKPVYTPYVTTNPSTFTFSPEGSGTGGMYMSASAASHPYGSKNSALIPTFGGTDHRWTITDNFTWMRGAHSFRFGGDLRLTRSKQDTDGNGGQSFTNNALSYPIAFGGFTDYAIPGWQYPNDIGLIGTQQFDLNPGGGVSVGSTGTRAGMMDLLTYMSGSLSTIRQQYFVNNPFDRTWNDAIGKGEMFQIVDMRQKEFSFFAKDDWRVRANFTVNLGVRWEYYGIPWLANGMTVGLQDSGLGMFGVTGRSIGTWMAASPVQLDNSYLTKQIFIGPNSPNPDTVLYNQDYNNFGPAVGFSWQLPWLGRGRTVLRSGYQLSYRAIGNASSQGYGAALANEPGTTYAQFYRGSTNDTYMSVANLADHIPANKFMDPSIVPLDTMKIKNHSANYTAFDPNVRTPYTQSINFSITRTIGNNITIDARYVGTLARKGIGDININTPNFINNGLINALNEARKGGNPAMLNNMLKGFVFGQVGNWTAVGAAGGPSGADIVRSKWASSLANGDYATIANNLANLNYDKKVTSFQDNTVRLINQTYPDLPAEEKGAVLRANGYAENYILGNPQMGTRANYRSNLIHSNYHSMQAQVQLRPTRGVMFTSTYTFSKTLADQPGGGGFGFFGGGGGWTDPLNRAMDYKLSTNSARHQWNNYGMMDLPLGANGYFFRGVQNGIAKRFIEGWQFSWTMRMQSGRPSQVSGGTNHLYSSGTLMDLVPDMDPTRNPNGDLKLGLELARKLAPGNSTLEWPAGSNQGAYYGMGTSAAKYATIVDPQCLNPDVFKPTTGSSANYYTTGSCTLRGLGLASTVVSAAQYASNPSAYPGYAPDTTTSRYYKVILQNPLPGRQGNFSSYIEGLGSFSLDMGMTKSIQLTEGKSLNIRMNASNILNHPSPSSPAFNISGGFGTFGVTQLKSGNRTFQGNITIRF